MRVQCPSCQLYLTAPNEAQGRRARCKGCGKEFVISAAHVPAEQPPQAKPATRDCPNCGAVIDAKAILCHGCGLNLETGRLPEPEGAEEWTDADERLPWYLRALEFVGTLLPGLFRPGLLVLSIFLALVGFTVMGFCVFLAMLGALIEACMVGGFGLLIYGQALAMLLQGDTGLLQELLAELDGRRWLLFFFLLFAPFVAMYFIVRAHMAP